MIKKVLKRLFGGRQPQPLVLSASQHGIRRSDIPEGILAIVKKLQESGYTAYIVGGAVRDILLGFHPKDFDIAADATPEQIKKIFPRRARIIGRRFPIVHVYGGSKKKTFFSDYTEVATFRSKKDTYGAKTRYGSPYEDAWRRDFTINGLFYDPVSQKLYDYVEGTADIKTKRLRMIGKIKKRLPEDPVRILRALRLSTKLGLTMSDMLENQLADNAGDLAGISSARLFDEMIKVINCGAGTRIFQQWQQFGVCPHFIPILEEDNPMFFSVMAENDRRLAEKRNHSVSFIVAALFWKKTAEAWHQERGGGLSPMQAMEKAIGAAPFRENKIIPQRLLAKAKDLYFLQAQMENNPTARRTRHIIEKPLFDRALAFASIRPDSGAAQTASWWSQYVQGSAEERELLLKSSPREKRRRRRRARKKSAPPAEE